MKIKIYNGLFYFSSFMALLAIYCKILVTQLNILLKSDIEIIMSFIYGICLSAFMLFLLHYLIQKIQK